MVTGVLLFTSVVVTPGKGTSPIVPPIGVEAQSVIPLKMALPGKLV